ncbi:hypothetical protein B0H17DRAFT_1135920 [Mycena rosella]|uniref:Uncharacterized protein n=1 Tax=Mycena rosella TaxID=1033263 RepID=A0AAD7DEY6_MYCRO|nr:hypothetical protein B0H17DRAFT_1135920 [Mycena rosella]
MSGSLRGMDPWEVNQVQDHPWVILGATKTESGAEQRMYNNIPSARNRRGVRGGSNMFQYRSALTRCNGASALSVHDGGLQRSGCNKLKYMVNYEGFYSKWCSVVLGAASSVSERGIDEPWELGTHPGSVLRIPGAEYKVLLSFVLKILLSVVSIHGRECNILATDINRTTLGYISPAFDSSGLYGTFQPSQPSALALPLPFAPKVFTRLNLRTLNGLTSTPDSTYPFFSGIVWGNERLGLYQNGYACVFIHSGDRD